MNKVNLDDFTRLQHASPYWDWLAYASVNKLLKGIERTHPLAYEMAYYFQENKKSSDYGDHAALHFFKRDVIFPIPGRSSDQALLEKTLKNEKNKLDAYYADSDIPQDDEDMRLLKKKQSSRYSKSQGSKNKNKVLDVDWAYLNYYFDKTLRDKKQHIATNQLSPELQQLDEFLNAMGAVDDDTKAYVKAKICMMHSRPLHNFIDKISIGHDQENILLGYMFDFNPEKIKYLFDEQSPLQRIGFLQKDKLWSTPTINKDIYKLVTQHSNGHVGLVEKIVGKPVTTHLTLNHYPHYQNQIQTAMASLEDSSTSQRKGVNILLYGSVGTGKTQLAAAMLHHLGVTAYKPGQTMDDGLKPMGRENRLSNLMLAQHVLKNHANVGLICDEFEDFLPSKQNNNSVGNPQAKLFTNMLFEENTIPVVWTTNTTDFDEAFKRRFTYAINVEEPPVYVREIIIDLIAKQNDVKMDGDEVRKLAHRFECSPAILDNAFKVARSISDNGANKDKFYQGLDSSIESMGLLIVGTRKAYYVSNRLNDDFNRNLIAVTNSLNVPQNELEDTLKQRNKNFHPKFIVQGQKDTGKTEWAKYVSLELLEKDCDIYNFHNLIGLTDGQTIGNIKSILEEAENSKKSVIIKGAAPLLQTEPNTFNFVPHMADIIGKANTPFILIQDTAEPAQKSIHSTIASRADAIIKTAYMGPAEMIVGFNSYLNMSVPPELAENDKLTVPLFRQAARQMVLMGIEDNPAKIVQMFKAVVENSSGQDSVGFKLSYKN